MASRPASGSRRAARERALSLLYEAEVKGQTIPEVLEALPVAPEAFVIEIVAGVARSGVAIDGLISRFSIDWPLARMPVVDRSLLRMAVFELTERPATPVAVVIDEAVDLAKLYSTEASGSFVNGLLSAVAASVRPSC